MKFETNILKIHKTRTPTTQNINTASCLFIFLGFTFILGSFALFKVEPMTPVIFIFLGYLLLVINHALQFKDFEKIDYEYCGILRFGKREIELNNVTIPLVEINKLEVIIDGYYGAKINFKKRFSGQLPVERKKLGVKNILRLTRNSDNYEVLFQLNNKAALNTFYAILYQAIISKNLINLHPISAIQLIPTSYKTNPKTKAYIKDLINSGQMSYSEGLFFLETEKTKP